jgi:hypothetical protein
MDAPFDFVTCCKILYFIKNLMLVLCSNNLLHAFLINNTGSGNRLLCALYVPPDELISSAGSYPLNGSLSPEGDTDDSGGSHSTNSSDSDFIIPELPSGSKMELNIHSTWGDRHYLGLNGIEVFSSTGQHVTVAKVTAVTDILFKILRWHYSLHIKMLRMCR